MESRSEILRGAPALKNIGGASKSPRCLGERLRASPSCAPPRGSWQYALFTQGPYILLWVFPKSRGTLFRGHIIRILLFRVLY